MRDILLVARNHVVTAVREKITLFWFLIFPVFLLVVLSLIFGQIGQEGEISFQIALANADQASNAPFSAIIEAAFDEVAELPASGREPLFQLRKPGKGSDVNAFIEAQLTAVRRGRLAALIVLPHGLGEAIQRNLMTRSSTQASLDAPGVEIHFSEGNAASDMSVSIIDQILSGIDREILAQGGAYDRDAAIPQYKAWVGTMSEEAPYVDFLLPGIVIMGFFMNGLFGIPGAILFSRDQLVLRRYWVTPLTVPRFLAGISVGHLVLCVVQFALVYSVGRFALGASVSFANVETALVLLLAAATFMAFGFLIAAVSKTANSGMAIANILNMPMMFLSGLFFPIAGLPFVIRLIVFVNPVSYLADRLRASLDVSVAAYPALVAVLVPAGWVLLSAAIAAWRLRWDVGR